MSDLSDEMLDAVAAFLIVEWRLGYEVEWYPEPIEGWPGALVFDDDYDGRDATSVSEPVLRFFEMLHARLPAPEV